MDIKKLVKPNILSLRAYQAKEIPCRVKLDANESPYSGVSIQGSGISNKNIFKSLNRYPDPEAKSLKKLIAGAQKLKPENIIMGNGSDELIYYLITTFGGPVLYPSPTFSMYGIISQAIGEKKIEIPLDNKFDLDISSMLNAIKKQKPKLIFLSSPNNPTGNSFSSVRMKKILDAASIVVIDEAYQAFSSKKSFVPLLKKYKNLIILNTLSKIGFAGLRIGFMLADPEIADEVNKVRLPFNLNSLSQAIAVKALKNKRRIKSDIRSIISERKRLLTEMKKIEDIKPYPSDANFILFKVYPVRSNNSNGAKNSDTLYKKLLEQGVLVRNMKGIVNGCLRVTVGTPKENTIFLKSL